MTSKMTFYEWVKNLFKKTPTGSSAPLLLKNKVVEEREYNAISKRDAKFQIGQVVQHKAFPFRGVIFDVDPQFQNSDEWYDSIPEEVRPHKDQPFYHLFAENGRTHYIAYVSEQNLLADTSLQPVDHPDIPELFTLQDDGLYQLKKHTAN